MIYLPRRGFGFGYGEGNTDIEKKISVQSHYSGDITKEAARLLQSSEDNYFPAFEKDQDVLTFAVIVLLWFAEWMLSISFVIDRDQRILKKWLTNGTIALKDVSSRGVTTGYNQLQKRFKQGLMLTVPAITGFTPLLIGLIQTYKRRKACVGVVVAGWSRSILKGMGIQSISFRYEEKSNFGNLFTQYAIATLIASVLMGF